ncbi:hypothetical protein ACFFMM_10720 [Micromonospora chaiyaphumensis]|nr:hypothetical protein [Micromonospora chaiyaphumensis]
MPAAFGRFRPVGDVRRVRSADVEVNFGGGPKRLARSTRVLNLRPADGLVPVDGQVHWSQLDALPQCLTVEWSGPERGIIEAVAARPGIRFLYWDDAVGDIDLTSTNLGTVRLNGAGLRSVRLPKSVGTLLLRRPPAALRVEAPEMGHGLDLRLFPYTSDLVVPDGLHRTRKVWLWVGGEMSAAVLAGLTDLEDLRLTFGEPPGVLTDLPELGRHQRLHSLQLDDAYGLDPENLPELPSLRHLTLNGTRRATATAVKARLKGGAVTVSVNGAKSEAWLAAHMDNPFRDWVEDSEAFGQAACAAYNRARRAVDAIAPEAPDRLDAAERALRGLVAELNVADDEHGLIDTNYREQAWAVFCDLAKRLCVPETQVTSWFDEGRRF